MHRFFVKPTAFQGQQVLFQDEQARQIGKVLRLRPGLHVMVLDDTGWEYEVRLTHVTRRQVRGDLVAKRLCKAEPDTRVTLYQSLLKGDKFEWVLQKGTEIGVTRFVPLVTSRTVVRDPALANANKLARWRRILTEAAEQSRRGRVPMLAAPVRLGQALLEMTPGQMGLMPWEGLFQLSGETSAGLAGADIRTAVAGGPAAVALFIGPEGGFAREEVEEGRTHGLIPVTLGRRVLRAETAAMVAITLVLHELGDLTTAGRNNEEPR